MNKEEPDGTNNNPSATATQNQPVPKMEVVESGGGSSSDIKDEDGVWSADIEQAFKESLAIYPPCGRRKIILSEEGKMYGRNEMIARYILLKTGKKRTRKQVSSHIQVLARRMQRDKNITKNNNDGISGSLTAANPARRAEIIEQVPRDTYLIPKTEQRADSPQQQQPSATVVARGQSYLGTDHVRLQSFNVQVNQSKEEITVDDSFEDRGHTFFSVDSDSISINSESIKIAQLSDKFHSDSQNDGLMQLYEHGPKDAFYLIKFWADLNFDDDPELAKTYEMNTSFQSVTSRQVEVKTVAYSFGEEAVSKSETIGPIDSVSGGFKYEINTQLCGYGTGFIERLLQLWPDKAKMNKVLEHFTVLHVLRDAQSQETLLVMALVFAVSDGAGPDQRSTYNIYKLKP